MSGKGGVGKSTVAVQLALTFRKFRKKVGILDIDLCGPSITHMLGLEDKDVHQCEQGWVPVYADNEKSLAVMSTGFLLKRKEDAIIWRGPKKNAIIKQFLEDVYWQDIDILIIDTPPGTSDEHLSVVENIKQLKPDGAILVTTPQGVSINDVRRELTFCKKAEIPVLGIIENMSGFVCPNCSECTNIFSTGNGKLFADNANVKFLVHIKIKSSKCVGKRWKISLYSTTMIKNIRNGSFKLCICKKVLFFLFDMIFVDI
ncbi:cytosolic Fe-S cluster assembly factor NUBP2 homolog isoform X1 [Centruroides sculpturatus]|uniref:cytosolic Fe-S cluster assembly factor NUBP2 homolog isoform X1 n=1 Tax=Centruroides sculpturatus TaxID=218467 RepID=UPI000C6CA08C|nr:cytosolic Fe-S cluster assembly factor NUBP2 homolog isoform X1 [Centruroides sculpturatus]